MLLDTVALYRAATDPDHLSPAVQSLLRDPSNDVRFASYGVEVIW